MFKVICENITVVLFICLFIHADLFCQQLLYVFNIQYTQFFMN